MKNILATVTLAGALGLGGCVTTGGFTPEQEAQIAAVQAAAVQVCGFLPTVSTITQIVSSFVPGAGAGVAVGTQIAQAICGAVTAKGLKKGVAGTPMVNGVAVKGQFVR